MICTAGGLLEREGLALRETVYEGADVGYFDYPMSMGDRFARVEDGDGRIALRYKHHLRMERFESVCRMLPELRGAGLDGLAGRPLFTERLAELAAAERSQTAVEGGPCLYGVDEVYTILQLRGGASLCFDDSSGACRTEEGGPGLAEVLRERGGEVEGVSFLDLKTGFSSQELELFTALFGTAAALECPLVLSLPDMSYRKYFAQLARHLRPGVREQAEEAYGRTVHRIADLYLELARRMEARFPVPRLVLLHERERDAYGRFLRERERFCTIRDVTTNRPDMREAIHDYMTLPAAPHYLLGARHILEINSTDEADPLRKCAKIHKKAVSFHLLMLPEPVGADGRTTVFCSRREDKGYVALEAAAGGPEREHAHLTAG